MDSVGIQTEYIPRIARLEPRIRLKVHRKSGSGVVEICWPVIEAVCHPESESHLDVLAAFRASVPLMEFLKQTIADMPVADVTVVTTDRFSSRLLVKRNGCQPIYYQFPGTTEPLKVGRLERQFPSG